VAATESCPGEAASKREDTGAAEAAREDNVRTVAVRRRVELALQLAAFQVVPRQRAVVVECAGRSDTAADEGENATAGQVPAARDAVLGLRDRDLR